MTPSLPLSIVGDDSVLTMQAIELATELGYGPITLFTESVIKEKALLEDGLPIEIRPRSLVQESSCGNYFVALADPREREEMVGYLSAATLVNLIHPSAVISASSELATNIYVGAQAFIAMSAKVGDGVVQNALSSIEHNNVIGSYTFMGVGAILCGRVTTEPYAFIGAGAVIQPDVNIGRSALIGTGAVQVTDAVANGTYIGNPARLKK